MLWIVLNAALAANPTLAVDATADATATAEVAPLLEALEATEVDLDKIEVAYDDGVVELSGEVPTLEDRDALVATARGVDGIRRVEANLQLASGEIAVPQAAVNMPESRQLTVAEISEDTAADVRGQVMFELVRSPRVESTGVIVTGDNGEIVLSGFVQSSSEKRAAQQIAERAGATSIDNQIEVVGHPGSTP